MQIDLYQESSTLDSQGEYSARCLPGHLARCPIVTCPSAIGALDQVYKYKTIKNHPWKWPDYASDSHLMKYSVNALT